MAKKKASKKLKLYRVSGTTTSSVFDHLVFEISKRRALKRVSAFITDTNPTFKVRRYKPEYAEIITGTGNEVIEMGEVEVKAN